MISARQVVDGSLHVHVIPLTRPRSARHIPSSTQSKIERRVRAVSVGGRDSKEGNDLVA